ISGRLSAKKKAEALARKEQQYRELILKAYRAEPLADSGFFHGKSSSRLVVIGPINLPVGRLFVEEVVTECRKRGATRVDVLAIELADVSVYDSQGLAEYIAAELKQGKSEVVCEQGQLLKLSNNEDGVITRTVLTKHWPDWVDYWAVDVDYESRKEIIKVAKNL